MAKKINQAFEQKINFRVMEDEDIINFETITTGNFYQHIIKIEKIWKDLDFYYYKKNANELHEWDFVKSEEYLIDNLFRINDLSKNVSNKENDANNYFNYILYKLIEFSHSSNVFFYWCSSKVYEKNFELRYKEYERSFIHTTIMDFIEVEYKNVLNSYSLIEEMKYINESNRKILNKSKDEKILFLDNLLKNLNTEVKINWGEKNKYELFYLDLVEIKDDEISEEETKLTEKIIYLYKLGIIDFLKSKQPFVSSTNSLAKIINKITDGNPNTIQSMINPMISKKVDEKNNPLNSKKAVEKVENQLINIGFNLNKSI